VDVLFFRGHVWERLAANVGVVLVFGALRAQAVVLAYETGLVQPGMPAKSAE
jgi:hypothetical protein